MQTERAAVADPAPERAPALRALVRRARQEIAATGHIADDTCRHLIGRFAALSAADRRALLRGLTRPRTAT